MKIKILFLFFIVYNLYFLPVENLNVQYVDKTNDNKEWSTVLPDFKITIIMDFNNSVYRISLHVNLVAYSIQKKV